MAAVIVIITVLIFLVTRNIKYASSSIPVPDCLEGQAINVSDLLEDISF